jgi:hypothetical protein
VKNAPSSGGLRSGSTEKFTGLREVFFGLLPVILAGCGQVFCSQPLTAQSGVEHVSTFNLQSHGWVPPDRRQVDRLPMVVDHAGRVLVGFTVRERRGLVTRDEPSLGRGGAYDKGPRPHAGYISGHVTARRIAVYDLEAGKDITSIPIATNHRCCFEFNLSPDGRRLAVLEDGEVKVIDLQASSAAQMAGTLAR